MFFDGLNSSKVLKIDTMQGVEQSAPDLDDDFLFDNEVADDIEEAPIREAGNEINDGETTYNTSNDSGKEASVLSPSSTETPKRSEQETAAAITDVGVVEKDDAFGNASINDSPMSPKSDKTDDFKRDRGSNLLLEDDFPDIIDADPDTDYEE